MPEYQQDRPFEDDFRDPLAQPRARGGLPWWGCLLISGGVALMLMCGGFIAFVAYVGSVGPETKVYTGNEVPRRFTDVVRDLGLLEEGEPIRFFYSDALTDIREGLYFVTDRKVVVYIRSANVPATVVPFEQIEDAELQRNESFFEDSIIDLRLRDGSVVSFPVSSEMNRDELMFAAIQEAIEEGETREAP